MRRVPFEEKTNEDKVANSGSKYKPLTEREKVLEYLQMAAEQTTDYTLKYDIRLCLEVIQGKENQNISELKEAITELVIENKELVEQCDNLKLQLYSCHKSTNK
ncbi:hypothetical protein NEOKW01_1041 [Nematocida sp. AWRm80]|nr:hypothetical protein NEOKW01_1041 [Nematocida sp. AWRm80]